MIRVGERDVAKRDRAPDRFERPCAGSIDHLVRKAQDLDRLAELRELLHDIHDRLGSTVVIVTHDMTVAERCERTIALRDGRVVQDLRR